MKNTKHIWATFLITLICYTSFGQKNNEWQSYRYVEHAGYSKVLLDSVADEFWRMKSESFMVVHKGNILLSLGDPSRRFMCHSIRKSFMSAMFGIYINKGDLDLSKTLRELNIQDKDELTDTELNATVKHLISARSGIYHPAAYEPRSMEASRPERGSVKPGESFFYNNWDFNTLVTIFNQETGQDFFAAFMKDIARPIGMQDLRMEDMTYRNEPDKSIHPAYLFKMSTRDLARIGLLYIGKGKWRGQEIIPANWVEKSTSINSTTENFDGKDGYGYLWWIDNHSFGEQAFYASGLGGHRLYVLPDSDLIIVHRVNTYLMRSQRDENIVNLINMVLAAKTGKPDKKPVLEAFIPEKEPMKVAVVPESTLNEYLGTYIHSFFGEIEVYLEDGVLKITGDILGNFRLYPKSNTQFEIEDIPELLLTMVKTDDKSLKGTSATKVDQQGVPVNFNIYF